MGGVVLSTGQESNRNQEFGVILSFMYLWAIQMEMLSRQLDEQVWSSEESSRLDSRSSLERAILEIWRSRDINLGDVCI